MQDGSINMDMTRTPSLMMVDMETFHGEAAACHGLGLPETGNGEKRRELVRAKLRH